MDESSFILGVDLDGVVGDFYGAVRKIAAEWLNRPLDSLTSEVSYGLEEWGINEFGGCDRPHRFAVTQRNIFRGMEPIKNAPAQGFGHSTYAMAVENAEKARVKNLIGFHYNLMHSGRVLDAIGKERTQKHPFDFCMSYEGLSLTPQKGKLEKNENLQMGFSKKQGI
jgi:hypothetical protein